MFLRDESQIPIWTGLLLLSIVLVDFSTAPPSINTYPHNARGACGKQRLDESDGGVGGDGDTSCRSLLVFARLTRLK